MHPDLISQTLRNRYRVEAFLGRGGMADVYKVWDGERATYLALKLLHDDLAEDPVFLRRFRREAENLARLQHPHIVRFYGLERDDLRAFMLMDYVEGTTLRAEIVRSQVRRLSPERVLEVMRPVCSALYYAHRLETVHCDLKPANVMIHKNGTVLVTDFGIARIAEGATTMTMVGAGTPAYMAPEQVLGSLLTPQTDIYALGVVLFEMLTGGERPFIGEQARITGSTGEKVRWEHLNLPAPSPRQYNPNLSSALEAVVLKCLEKEPSQRYPSMMLFLQALEQAVQPSAVAVATPTSPEPETGMGEPEVEVRASVTGKIRGQRLKGIWIVAIAAIVIAITLLAVLARSTNLLAPAVQTASPVGYILFTSDRDDGAEIYQVTSQGEIIRLTYTRGEGSSVQPVSDPRGYIFYTLIRDGKGEIYRLDRDGKTVRVTTTINGECRDPTIDPDGNLLFTSNRDGKYEIYRMESNGEVIRVTYTPGAAGSWEPSIDWQGNLIFTSNRDGKRDIYRMEQDGRVIRLTRTPGNAGSESPVSDPNGYMLFVSNRDGKKEIYRMGSNGMFIQVTNTPDRGESWEPAVDNQNNLLFTSDRDGKKELYRIESDGRTSRLTYTLGNGSSWDAAPDQ